MSQQRAQAVFQTKQKNVTAMASRSSILHPAAIIPALTPVHSGVLQRCSNGVECADCRAKRLERESLQRAAVSASAVPPIVHDVLNSPGHPLDAGARTFMEPRFGHDFSGVRVHTDARAAESARSVNALAYTVGKNVVFGTGQYAPGTGEGRRLLAHELTHVVQQGIENATVLQRAPEDSYGQSSDSNATPLPATSKSGTGLTLTVGPPRSTLLGKQFPLPAFLQLTNIFDLQARKTPSFLLELSPRFLVGTILGNVDLEAHTRPGTPPNATPSNENLARISLVNPIITFNTQTGRFTGKATLSIGSDYPPSFKGPTEVEVEMSSSQPGQFSGTLGYGPVHSDFTIKLHYASERLEQALKPVLTPEGGLDGMWNKFQAILRNTIPGIRFNGITDTLKSAFDVLVAGRIQVSDFVTRTIRLLGASISPDISLQSLQKALTDFGNEITHPGFTIQGSAGIGAWTLSKFTATTPSTVPIAHPLPGAPSKYALSTSSYGVIIAPAGSLFNVAAPAAGYTTSSYNEKRGFSATAALLPSLSLSAIQAHEPLLNQIPVYAYVDIAYVTRVSKDLDIGLRLTVNASTPAFGGGGGQGSANSAQQLTKTIQNYQQAIAGPDTNRDTAQGPPPLGVGLKIEGKFNGL